MTFRGFQRTVSLQPDSTAGRDLSARLAALAKETLAEAQAAGEFPDLYVRAVNGRRNAPEETVRLPGPIVYTADWARRAAAVAIGQLQKRAPVLSGAYRNSFFVLADGVQVEPEAIPFGAEVYVTNDQPYARKVQVGVKGFKDTRGLFDDAAAATQRLFPGVIRCRAVFIRLAGGYRRKTADTSRRRARGRRAADTEITYPAIRIDRIATSFN
jgi:hypothetical protein